jgi:hypothetical protein
MDTTDTIGHKENWGENKDTYSSSGDSAEYFPPMKINIQNNTYIPVHYETKYFDYHLDLLVDQRGEYSVKISIDCSKNKFNNRFELMEIE